MKKSPMMWYIQGRRRTCPLVLMESEKAEAQLDHARVCEEGNCFVGTAQVRGGVVFVVSGQGFSHCPENGVSPERVGRHDAGACWRE